MRFVSKKKVERGTCLGHMEVLQNETPTKEVLEKKLGNAGLEDFILFS